MRFLFTKLCEQHREAVRKGLHHVLFIDFPQILVDLLFDRRPLAVFTFGVHLSDPTLACTIRNE